MESQRLGTSETGVTVRSTVSRAWRSTDTGFADQGLPVKLPMRRPVGRSRTATEYSWDFIPNKTAFELSYSTLLECDTGSVSGNFQWVLWLWRRLLISITWQQVIHLELWCPTRNSEELIANFRFMPQFGVTVWFNYRQQLALLSKHSRVKMYASSSNPDYYFSGWWNWCFTWECKYVLDLR